MANFNYVTNFNTLDTIGNNLSEAKSNFGREFEIFERLLHSDPENLNGVCSSVVEDARKINTALVGLSTAFDAYKESIEALEKSLLEFSVEGVEAPTEFIGGGEYGGFSKNVDEVVLPILSGERLDNKELGYITNAKTAADFIEDWRDGDIIGDGHCTAYVQKYIELYGADVSGHAISYWRKYNDADPNSKDFSEGERNFINNFEFIENPSYDDLQDGDIIIWEPYSDFMNNSEWREYGHCAIWSDGNAWGQHQRGSGSTDWSSCGRSSIVPQDMKGIHIIRPSKGNTNG